MKNYCSASRELEELNGECGESESDQLETEHGQTW